MTSKFFYLFGITLSSSDAVGLLCLSQYLESLTLNEVNSESLIRRTTRARVCVRVRERETERG